MTISRWKATSIHFGLCLILYVALLYPILFLWFPHPYFAVDGGWQGVSLITGVDLVLGPLLTLIIYRPGKPGLRRDLALIGILQIAAIVWGTGLVYQQRTAMVVYADGIFYTLNHEQLLGIGGEALVIAERAETIPPYAIVRIPTDPSERRKFILQTVLYAKTPLIYLVDRYEMLGESNFQIVLEQGQDIRPYLTTSTQNRQELDRFLDQHGGKLEDYVLVPLVARYHQTLLAMRRADGQPVDVLDIDQTEPKPESRKGAPISGEKERK